LSFRVFKAATSIVVFSLYLITAARASSVVPLDLDEIIAGAEHIVHVRCTGNAVESDPDVGVVTISSFVVLDRAKGAAASTFAVRQAGGELQGVKVDYHVPKFRAGDEYVLFMPPPSRLGLASPVGLAQGAFSVLPGAAGKEVSNGRDFAELISAADAARLPPRMAARLKQERHARSRADLGEFMALTRAKAATR